MSFRALVIGVDRYPRLSPGAQLQGSVNDARAMHGFLTERLSLGEDRARLLLDPEGAAIRAAFAALVEAAGDGDEVIVFYAGHGVRYAHATTGQYMYGFAPSDTDLDSDLFVNLLDGTELNELANRLLARGAWPTLIADTCHSAGGVRGDIGGRERRLRRPSGKPMVLGDAEWDAVRARQPLTVFERPAVGRGSLAGRPGGSDWVMLAACRDFEAAREDAVGGGQVRGRLTYALLHELSRVPADGVGELRWSDIMGGIRRTVSSAAQTPVLEGRAERPLFGGAWRPYEPGFDVHPTADPAIVDVRAGELHGLGPDAVLAIYPPGTAVFEDVQPLAHAVIVTTGPISSTARIPAGLSVAVASRAILLRPGPHTPRIRVRTPATLAGPLRAGVLETAADFVELVDAGPADVELLLTADDRLAIVPFAETRTDDDRIAALPAHALAGAPDVLLRVGKALGAGLVHWARYLQLRDRSHFDDTLNRLVRVSLYRGNSPEAAKPVSPDPAGVHHVDHAAPLFAVAAIRPFSGRRIFVGLIACSDDGNAFHLWPPPDAEPGIGVIGSDEFDLPVVQTVYLGDGDQTTPVQLEATPGKTVSRWTLKVIACAIGLDTGPPDLSALAIEQTVQEVINRLLPDRKGDVHGATRARRPAPPISWCTWDLRVAITR